MSAIRHVRLRAGAAPVLARMSGGEMDLARLQREFMDGLFARLARGEADADASDTVEEGR